MTANKIPSLGNALFQDSLLTLCSETSTAQAAAAVVKAGDQICLSISSMLDYLDEPLKSKFLEVKGQINTMLAGMAETDKVPAATEANYVLRQLMSVLSCAQSMMAGLTETAKAANERYVTTKASIGGEVEKAINDQVGKGDLIKKADHTLAIEEAVKQARKTFELEAKTISDRRTSLSSLSLPAPQDAVLSGDDAAFKAKTEAAKARAEQLKGFKISPERLTTLCWAVDDSSFKDTVEMLKENASTEKPKPNPFVQSTNVPAINRNIGMI